VGFIESFDLINHAEPLPSDPAADESAARFRFETEE
jgi:hypothetical protein